MNRSFTILLLIAAGISLIVQNLLMVRITATASTVLIALVINSGAGLGLLLLLLLGRNGLDGIVEAVGTIRPWSLLPGLLGSFFVFAGIHGYQRIGAASTIAVLVASQLVTGLIVDASRSTSANYFQSHAFSVLGGVLLIAGAFLVVRRSF
ncbi:DMT family transporter [Paraburkholderia kururiensis]|uniref:DMT family transporter n=1 Tax=Paraburkholderia kururiensis TaxID=984307 RepID=UPI000F8646B2|nr:DMT family transporter [Paraburkholderia kururiensis]